MQNITKALLALLSKGIVRFTYRKVDGTIREAVGTRNISLLNPARYSVPEPKGRRNNPTAYYDIDKEDWRSFKAENVIAVNGIEINEIKGIKGNRIIKVGSTEEVDIPIAIGVGISKDDICKDWEELGKEIEIELPIGKCGGIPIGMGGTPKVSNPIPISGGVGLPISGVSGKEITIDDFAKLVAKYVVAELAEKLR